MVYWKYLKDSENNVKDERIRKFDKCIPDDLILSLKQADQPKEYLGPPSKKNLVGIKPTIPVRNKKYFLLIETIYRSSNFNCYFSIQLVNNKKAGQCMEP